jgi:hypothetical protein
MEWNIYEIFRTSLGRGVRSPSPKGTALGQKQSVSRKSISSLSFCPTGVWHTFSETLGPWLKCLGSQILNLGLGPKILGPEWAGTCQKVCLLNLAFSHKIDTFHYNWILRTFYLWDFLIWGHPSGLAKSKIQNFQKNPNLVGGLRSNCLIT